MSVLTEIKQGTWSEVSITRGVTRVPGMFAAQETDVKNQSRRSRRGSNYLIVQVYFLPKRGNSITPKALIASLKRNISEMSPPSLFLSSGIRRRFEITKEKPIHFTRHLYEFEPVGELLFARRSTRAINICKHPVHCIVIWNKFHSNPKLITEHQITIEKMWFPNGDNTSWGTYWR